MTRPLNFLHLTTFYPPYSFGGDSIYVYRLAHALGDAGHSVDVIHCIDSYHLLHPGDPETNFPEHPNVKVHGLRSGYGWLSPLLTHQTGRAYLKQDRIREILNSKPYDVVHYHNISLLGPDILTYEPPRNRTVKIYTAHEHWLICPTHVLWKFNSHPCEKPECLRCVIKARRPPQVWRSTDLLARSSRFVDEFVSPSRFTARMHAQRGFYRPLTQLPYFLDRSDGDWRTPGPRPQEKPYFLFVGRLEVIKGLQSLIKLWSHTHDFDLLVAGSGSYEEELCIQAAPHAGIKFLGNLSQSQLGNLYFHALACIVPSVTYETFGMIIIEAFARKTPVIVRDLGALPELVQESGGGCICNTDEELLNAMRRIASSSTLRHELGENGYQAFLAHWSKDAHIKLYFDLLRATAIRKFGVVPWERARPSDRKDRKAAAIERKPLCTI